MHKAQVKAYVARTTPVKLDLNLVAWLDDLGKTQKLGASRPKIIRQVCAWYWCLLSPPFSLCASLAHTTLPVVSAR